MNTDKDRISALEARMYRLEMALGLRQHAEPPTNPIECLTCLMPIGGNRVIRCTDDECSAGLNTGSTA